jgi:hypothetical protein
MTSPEALLTGTPKEITSRLYARERRGADTKVLPSRLKAVAIRIGAERAAGSSWLDATVRPPASKTSNSR